MGSVWLSKKAFLYFGGTAIILIGAAIVLMAPYHFNNFAVIENEQRSFDILDQDGYYPRLEIAVSLRVGNSTTVVIGFVLVENLTLDTYIVNITLDESNIVESQDEMFLQDNLVVDILPGNYTVTFEQIEGAGRIDIGFEQASDSRLFVFIGGSMNIIGLIMGIVGYFVPGTFLPTDSDTIVAWGYEDKEREDTYPEN
ncbi:MAG: hypothetical protein ACXAC0_10230 [Candidatus Thorarchaeota archaeon]|jgi:hypothetical protein